MHVTESLFLCNFRKVSRFEILLLKSCRHSQMAAALNTTNSLWIMQRHKLYYNTMWHGVHVKPEEIDFNALFTAFVLGLHKEPSFSCLSKKLFPLSLSISDAPFRIEWAAKYFGGSSTQRHVQQYDKNLWAQKMSRFRTLQIQMFLFTIHWMFLYYIL